MWRASPVSGYPTLRDDWFHLEPHKIGFHIWIIILWMVSSKAVTRPWGMIGSIWNHKETKFYNWIIKTYVAGIVKRLRPWIVVPLCVGSNPTVRPIYKKDLLIRSFFIFQFRIKNLNLWMPIEIRRIFCL